MKITNYKLQATKLGLTLTKAFRRTERGFTLTKARRTESAFTLIEMLVVISIIGILASLASVSFSSTQKQARDTQRKSDLKQYQNALEAFANKNSSMYPAWSGNNKKLAEICANTPLETGSTCPEDPRYDPADGDPPPYRYQSDTLLNNYTPNATKYVLWAKLENVENTFWVVCSTGQSGKVSSATVISGGVCPALTQ